MSSLEDIARTVATGTNSQRYDPERQGGFDDKTMFTLRGAVTHGIMEISHSDEVIREHGDKCPTLQQRMGTGGNQVPMVVANMVCEGDAHSGFRDDAGLVFNDNVYGVRRLTPRECERLQGFPDDWTACLSDSARYRCLGNAIAVPVVEWIGKRIAICNQRLEQETML